MTGNPLTPYEVITPHVAVQDLGEQLGLHVVADGVGVGSTLARSDVVNLRDYLGRWLTGRV